MIVEWLNPLSGLDLQNAVNAKKKSVMLEVGPDNVKTEFNITYVNDKFWLEPEYGLVPCGWFDINKVLQRYV